MAIPGKNADLIRRFKLYGFGFALGLLVVSLVYKGKGCQLPNSAKMEELGWQKLEYCGQGSCKITEVEIREVLGTGANAGKGKVNYDKSDPRAEHHPQPTYAIEGSTSSGKDLRIIIADVDTISRVLTAIDLKNAADSCTCK
jgi:hypothetical protein